MLVVEVMMLLKEIELPAWFLPAMTAHELIQLGHNLFPAFLNGVGASARICSWTWTGTSARCWALHEQNKEVKSTGEISRRRSRTAAAPGPRGP